MILGAQVVLPGAQTHQIERVALFVGNGIRADVFQVGIQAAVNGEIIGSELDCGLLVGAEKGNISRFDLGFDQKGVVQRNDFDQVHAGLDGAADRVHLDLVDDTV